MMPKKEKQPLQADLEEMINRDLRIYHLLAGENTESPLIKTRPQAYGDSHRLALQGTYPNLYNHLQGDDRKRHELFDQILPMQSSFVQQVSFLDQPERFLGSSASVIDESSGSYRTTRPIDTDLKSDSNSYLRDNNWISSEISSAIMQEQIRLLWLDYGLRYLDDKITAGRDQLTSLEDYKAAETRIKESQEQISNLTGEIASIEDRIDHSEARIRGLKHDIFLRTPDLNGESILALENLHLNTEERKSYDATFKQWFQTVDVISEHDRVRALIKQLDADCQFADDIIKLLGREKTEANKNKLLKNIVSRGDIFDAKLAPEFVDAVENAVELFKNKVKHIWRFTPDAPNNYHRRRLERLDYIDENNQLKLSKFDKAALNNAQQQYPKSLLDYSVDALLSDENFGMSLLESAISSLKEKKEYYVLKGSEVLLKETPKLSSPPRSEDFFDPKVYHQRLSKVQKALNSEIKDLKAQVKSLTNSLKKDEDLLKNKTQLSSSLEKTSRLDRARLSEKSDDYLLLTSQKSEIEKNIRDNEKYSEGLGSLDGLDKLELSRGFCENIKKIDWYFTPNRIQFLSQHCFLPSITPYMSDYKQLSHDECLKAMIAEVRNLLDRDDLSGQFLTQVEIAYLKAIMMTELQYRGIQYGHQEEQDLIANTVMILAKYIPDHATDALNNLKAIISKEKDVRSIYEHVRQLDSDSSLVSTRIHKKKRLSSKLSHMMCMRMKLTDVYLDNAFNDGPGQLKEQTKISSRLPKKNQK